MLTLHHSLAICANTYQQTKFPPPQKKRKTQANSNNKIEKKNKRKKSLYYYFSLSFLFATVVVQGPIQAKSIYDRHGTTTLLYRPDPKPNFARLNKPPPPSLL